MITVASQEKPLRVIYDPRGSQSVNYRIDLARKPDIWIFRDSWITTR